MSKETKKGVTLQDKEESNNGFSMADYANFDMQDNTAIDPKLKAEIEGKNLKYRWINASKFKEAYGFDKRMWRPYKVDEKSSMSSSTYGTSDSEGYVRRGDLILAVRPVEIHQKAEDLIKQRNLANKAAMGSKAAAKALRASFKSNNVKGKIIEDGDDD